MVIAVEIAFWVLLGLALAVRYLAGRRRLSTILLVGVPLLDVLLLVMTAVRLGSGAAARFTDGLAAVYLGVSLVFGPGIIRWADERFAHRFAGGPSPSRPPRYGWARAAYEWREFGKTLVASGISAALLVAGILWVDDQGRTEALTDWLGRIPVAIVVAFIWSLTYTLFPKRAPDRTPG